MCKISTGSIDLNALHMGDPASYGMTKSDFFSEAFLGLTGHRPFPWQVRAFRQILDDVLLTYVSLPTGTGKTLLIAIWLIALAWQARNGGVTLPRRLVWVVNRRVVVDQATEEAAGIVQRLMRPGSAESPVTRQLLAEMAECLSALSLVGAMDQPPVAISTLRGQLADNGDWKLDPSRPAIVIGTVDMVGSRLLFSGYGDGKYKRPFHAGLLGQDAWVVLDEAHLTPAFASLLQAIHTEQGRFPRIAAWRFTLLSATQRARGGDAFGLAIDDETDDRLSLRLKASKSLFIYTPDEKDDELEHVAALALCHRDQRKRVIVFVKSPESANKVAARIGKDHGCDAVRVLTGTQRGFERDALAMDPIFVGFRSNPKREPPERTHYLISTAAGEVGADLDADHLICDLAPLDSLIQRFGRVNRLGLVEARVDLVVSAKKGDDEDQARRNATLGYLRGLPECANGGRSLSPTDLIAPPQAAFSTAPPVIPLARHWLDMWSLTSIGQADWLDRPEVAAWLHGAVDDLLETWVVWRDDVEWLGDPSLVSENDCARTFDVCPILPQEQLREPTFRVRDKLKKLAEQRGNGNQPVILALSDGSIGWRGTLQRLAAELDEGEIRLPFSTIFLPTAVGGLNEQGCFDPRSSTADDKADAGKRRRFLLLEDGPQWRAFPLPRAGDQSAYAESSRLELIAAIAKAEGLKPVATLSLTDSAEEAPEGHAAKRCLLYLAEVGSLADSSAKSFVAASPQPLPEHLRLVGRTARRLVELIAHPDSLFAELCEALGQAGYNHDTGKSRSCWQRAIGNPDLDKPLAKSGHDKFQTRLNGRYRHEFGSLIEAEKALPTQETRRDLILHTIAAHHGNARPHFKEQSYDRESPLGTCREVAGETLRRFGRLQACYGWWGLAYLEAILKAADALVSAGLVAGASQGDQHAPD